MWSGKLRLQSYKVLLFLQNRTISCSGATVSTSQCVLTGLLAATDVTDRKHDLQKPVCSAKPVFIKINSFSAHAF